MIHVRQYGRRRCSELLRSPDAAFITEHGFLVYFSKFERVVMITLYTFYNRH